MGRLGVVHAFGDAHNTDSIHSARSWKRELSADFGTSIKHFWNTFVGVSDRGPQPTSEFVLRALDSGW